MRATTGPSIGGLLQRIRCSRPVGFVRYHAYQWALAFPRLCTCNLCGWSGRHLLTHATSRHVLCPRCGSLVRHRLIRAALGAAAGGVVIEGRRVLHISPEYCLGRFLQPRAGRYVTLDYSTADANLRADVSRLPFAARAFDVVIACEVLEQVDDDRRALCEIKRVLRPGGVAILTVPTSDQMPQTYEDPAIVTPEGRIAAFGQFDHVRQYGADFGERIASAGFDVTVVRATDFPVEEVRRSVLAPPFGLVGGWTHHVHLARVR